ncbi:MAG: lipopolysaccharide heptosyltransferase II [Desulfatiglandaceae bacterium]
MKKQPDTILVRCPNWVGDVVMATPMFECLRRNYRQTKIVGLIRNYALGVIEEGPWFDRIIGCDDKTLSGFWALVRSIRNVGAEMAIVLPNSFRSILPLWFGGVREIYGYCRDQRSFLLSGGPVPLKEKDGILPVPMAEYYLEICRWLDLEIPERREPTLFMSDSVQEKGRRLVEKFGIKAGDMVIGLNPGAKFGTSKCWPPEYFARLAELFVERWDCKILLLVGPGEEEIAQAITDTSQAAIINTGPDRVDLSLLKYLIQRCQLLVTNDTGPRHYAVALDTPVVVIMGPTDPRYTAANLKKTLVLRKELDCSPCHLKVCPRDHKCMRSITPEDVFRGSEKILGKVS